MVASTGFSEPMQGSTAFGEGVHALFAVCGQATPPRLATQKNHLLIANKRIHDTIYGLWCNKLAFNLPVSQEVLTWANLFTLSLSLKS